MAESSKTSQRVAANITKYRIHAAPVHVDVDEIGADWLNRMGSAPNIQICHKVLAPSFKNDGYDTSKPQVGVCRSFEGNSDLINKLVSWNRSFTDELYPSVRKEKMNKGSLACTHVNITARLFKEVCVEVSYG